MATPACYHCGLPVSQPAGPSVVIDGEARAMCCTGCAAVATLIADSGLGGYYRHRDAPAPAAVDPGNGASDYALFDLPDASADFVATEADGSARAELAIDDIHCSACTWLLETAIARLPGVSHINVHLAERRARL